MAPLRIDFPGIRAALVEQLATVLPAVNVYGYPDPQPEYPAAMLPAFDLVTFHPVVEYGGAIVELRVELHAADADDVGTALEQLETLLALALGVEDATSAAFATVVVHSASNVRRRTQGEALSCDLVLSVHV
jgi:hypothetical protein